MVKKDKKDQKDNKADKKDAAVVYLEGVENNVVEEKLQEIVDEQDVGLELEDAVNIFVKKANNNYANTKIETAEKRMTYALGVVRTKFKAKRTFASKPTMPISCVMRNVGGIKNNYTNVTEETRGMDSNDDKIGIAGSWKRCLECARKWDTADMRYDTNCPSCSSTNSVVMANQAVPLGTQGIVNRHEMKVGNISGFNKTKTNIFCYNDETEDTDEAFLSFSGKQQNLLSKIQLGRPFTINVQSENIYVNDITDVVSYETTGTSKVTDCDIKDFPDILDIYNEMALSSVSDLSDGDYCTLFLEVVEEAKQPKDDGKWLVQFMEPVEDDEEEAVLLGAYFDDEDVAKQFSEDDQGVIECRYSESEISVGDDKEISRIINIQVDSCGLPVFILGENGTKFLSA